MGNFPIKLFSLFVFDVKIKECILSSLNELCFAFRGLFVLSFINRGNMYSMSVLALKTIYHTLLNGFAILLMKCIGSYVCDICFVGSR